VSVLEELAVDHPYYCSDSNYYSREFKQNYSTMTEFLDAWEELDVDQNLCFRWDVTHSKDDEAELGEYFAEVFIMEQRRGLFIPCMINSIDEDEAKRFKAYAEKHWNTIRKIWSPLAICEEQELGQK
tara:strand:+ start:11572 stop:11952 length:381 start_codon:yes stop_codon:yes gene_type:complete